MSDTSQRAQWAEHLKDEAVELQAQQESAGSTHSPLAGPLPHSAGDLDTAIQAERERCVRIAEGWASEDVLRGAFPGLSEAEMRVAVDVVHAIARSMRVGGSAEGSRTAGPACAVDG